ncbi:hypothetical protein GCK72_022686 [Caenorhabditis remanei]|uniref:Uncharacterized protein n=1 Tax=Caenorhabditis remanei TaxID=31234 RepID=A0A6A5FUL7_CAERE|nr:hypothetical protein GCK72_022686 [Caenorhabditis remanei]KAF1746233.1 hypothetical protein GCK72_022686 [Caenorhabditis remanei]
MANKASAGGIVMVWPEEFDWEWLWDGRSLPRGRPRYFGAQGPAPSNKTIGGTSQFLTEGGAMEERANNE